MESNELQQLAGMLRASGFTSLEFSRGDESVRLTVAQDDAMVTVTAEEAPDYLVAPEDHGVAVLAESAGLFLAGHPMRDRPFARVGEAVAKGDVLGLLKIGPIYAPVTAPADGVVARILTAEGALLGFGTPVLELAPIPA